MQTEPPKADPPKPKRRRYQFSLRTLMIVVTLFCVVVGGYVGWQAKIVAERASMRQRLEAAGAFFFPERPEFAPSWLRRQLGDFSAPAIYRPSDCGIGDSEIKRV